MPRMFVYVHTHHAHIKLTSKLAFGSVYVTGPSTSRHMASSPVPGPAGGFTLESLFLSTVSLWLFRMKEAIKLKM